jgi:hypothetical protein
MLLWNSLCVLKVGIGRESLLPFSVLPQTVFAPIGVNLKTPYLCCVKLLMKWRHYEYKKQSTTSIQYEYGNGYNEWNKITFEVYVNRF